MRGLFAHRFVHILLLLAVGSALAFPFLAAPSLWDDDEGVNAECAREMAEAGTWIVPVFNWELRTAKPVLLYWLLRASYDAFGTNEFAARLPSALAYLGSILLTYSLGRRMLDPATGLLAGVIAASTLELVKLGRAVTPDSTLVFCLLLYFWAFWRGHDNGGRRWFVPCGVASGLAMLAKGPVGLLLPAAVVGFHLLQHRELGRMLDRRMTGGVAAWILVAVPWYGLVTAETRGEWTRAFFLKENLGRSTEPMESHGGPWLYYLPVLAVFLAPWSSFLLATLRDAWLRAKAGGPEARALRFLLVWVAVVVVGFSLSATKLPHYVAPAYPALAILTAAFLVRWVRDAAMPGWATALGAAGFAITGLAVLLGLLLAGGRMEYWDFARNLRDFEGLEAWAWIGLLPVGGGGAFAWFARRGGRRPAVAVLVVSTVAFVGLLAAYPPVVVDRSKAAKELVAESGARDLHRDVRLAGYEYAPPSLTFYAARRVDRLTTPEEAAAFLAMPHPSFLFVPAAVWEDRVAPLAKPPWRIAARRYDLYRNGEVLVVVNDR